MLETLILLHLNALQQLILRIQLLLLDLGNLFHQGSNVGSQLLYFLRHR